MMDDKMDEKYKKKLLSIVLALLFAAAAAVLVCALLSGKEGDETERALVRDAAETEEHRADGSDNGRADEAEAEREKPGWEKDISAYGIKVRLPVPVKKTESGGGGSISWTGYLSRKGENYIVIQKFAGEKDAEKALRKAVAADGDIVRYVSRIRPVILGRGKKGYRLVYRFGDEYFTAYSFSRGGHSFVVDHNTKGDLGELRDRIVF